MKIEKFNDGNDMMLFGRGDSYNFYKGTLGVMSEGGCGPFTATPIFLKMET